MAHCLIVAPIVSSGAVLTPSKVRIGLKDVLASGLDAVLGRANRLGLPERRRVLVLLVDGLGDDALTARAGHARTLAGAPRRRVATGCPTTTAAALTTLTTATDPGRHGVVSYSALDPVADRVVNQLHGFDSPSGSGQRSELPPGWQREPTVFERAADAQVGAYAVGPRHYATSGFTREVLRGATYVGARSAADRLDTSLAALRSGGPAIAYCYVPELDVAAHREGWTSTAWTGLLETVDSAVADTVRALRTGETLLVTADHGIVDVPQRAQLLLGGIPGLLDGVRHVAGEPRLLHLHLDRDVDTGAAADRWREALGGRADVLTRQEAIDDRWFGDVDPVVAPRIGDLLVAARGTTAIYTEEADTARGMVGQHGSWTDAERFVPLVRFDG